MTVRSTQILTEIVYIPNPNARVTQLVTENAFILNPKAKVTQLVTENAVIINPNAKVTQLVTEVAYPNPGFASSPGNAAYSAIVLTESSLVSYWQLNETTGTTATDSADSNPGTYTGGFTLNQTGMGSTGAGVLFNGSTGYVAVSNATNLQFTGNFTLEALIKTTYSGNFAGIIAKYSATSGNPGYAIAPVASHLGVWTGNAWLTGTKVINDNNWHHVAATISSSGQIITYVDGLIDVIGLQTLTLTNTNSLYIGMDGTGSLYYSGIISNAAVYNSVLTPSVIYGHYIATK
jgi:hypothetical protein